MSGNNVAWLAVGVLAAPIGACALIGSAYLLRAAAAVAAIFASAIPSREASKGVVASALYGTKKAWVFSVGDIAIAITCGQNRERRNQMLDAVHDIEAIDVRELMADRKEDA